MRFTARLLKKALLDIDMKGPNGERKLGFTVNIGVPEISDWSFTLTKLPNGWNVEVQDDKHHVDLERFPSIQDAEAFLLGNSVQAIYEDILRLKKYNAKAEVLRVRVAKQIQAGLQEVMSEFERPFEG